MYEAVRRELKSKLNIQQSMEAVTTSSVVIGSGMTQTQELI